MPTAPSKPGSDPDVSTDPQEPHPPAPTPPPHPETDPDDWPEVGGPAD
jgi:hypothetical protein